MHEEQLTLERPHIARSVYQSEGDVYGRECEEDMRAWRERARSGGNAAEDGRGGGRRTEKDVPKETKVGGGGDLRVGGGGGERASGTRNGRQG